MRLLITFLPFLVFIVISLYPSMLGYGLLRSGIDEKNYKKVAQGVLLLSSVIGAYILFRFWLFDK